MDTIESLEEGEQVLRDIDRDDERLAQEERMIFIRGAEAKTDDEREIYARARPHLAVARCRLHERRLAAATRLAELQRLAAVDTVRVRRSPTRMRLVPRVARQRPRQFRSQVTRAAVTKTAAGDSGDGDPEPARPPLRLVAPIGGDE